MEINNIGCPSPARHNSCCFASPGLPAYSCYLKHHQMVPCLHQGNANYPPPYVFTIQPLER
eukprot:1152216-Pelagomonas_calceolata.AAC.6